MTARTFRLVADDYGLSPGVSRGIRLLIEKERLSGTGCMTLFSDWKESARHLLALDVPAEIGLHLTLTDFPAISSNEPLPPLKRLIFAVAAGTIPDEKIINELDAQLERFTQETGQLPAYLDGHQHVHFLKPVRQWLRERFADTPSGQRPWIRGAPVMAGAHPNIWPKLAFIKGLASGFDQQMSDAGLPVHGPLAGFYQWRTNGLFEKTLSSLMVSLPEGAVIMCHPGFVDDILRGRDILTDMREEEMSVLAGDAFSRLMASSGRKLIRPVS